MTSAHFDAERFRYLILAAQRLGQRQMNASMKAIGLTPAQSEVIRVLGQHQPITLKDLGELLICESGSPSRLIDRMVQDGLVEKEPHPSDARFVYLRLTPTGTEKARTIEEFEENMYRDLGLLFPNQEMSMVSDTLQKLLSHSPIADTLRKRGLLRDPAETD
ncbi:hypothetical protein J31TS4_38430 [Paenibacillus sp. J31TS4]|uniref:MarR family winged helix-turn-helix transcriptional regulator n=1 Tax=Paenibacillus sp. J31TS4 TaxID=2807195 RepID=UPI001B0AF39E|nr:MarR family transcriptional regulator [Paenibacillus sp. J31TS4]GIP40563.1 hypothetical protein J31TS4_38430 [Paenibacillus sp. J31TS4]